MHFPRFPTLISACGTPGRWLGLPCLLLAAALVPARAVERVLTIDGPTSVTAGASVRIVAAATTTATDAEQIGFFHAEYSTDGGKAWTGFCFDANAGKSAVRAVRFPVGVAGSTTLIRVRVAFRGGRQDVDYTGRPIDWDGSWKKWQEPPARVFRVVVTAPAADAGRK